LGTRCLDLGTVLAARHHVDANVHGRKQTNENAKLTPEGPDATQRANAACGRNDEDPKISRGGRNHLHDRHANACEQNSAVAEGRRKSKGRDHPCNNTVISSR